MVKRIVIILALAVPLARAGIFRGGDTPENLAWAKYAGNPVVWTNDPSYNYVQEPDVHALADGTFRMYFTSWDNFNGPWSSIWLASAPSPTGTWTLAQSTPVIDNSHGGEPAMWNGRFRCQLYDGQWMAWWTTGYGQVGDCIQMATSPDGTNWTNRGIVLTNGTEDVGLATMYVWRESPGNWHALYESATAENWRLFLASSPDGTNWTKENGGHVLSTFTSSGGLIGYSHAWVTPSKIGGLWHAWVHGSKTGVLPSDIYHYSSPDLTNWTAVTTAPVIARGTEIAGIDQVADPCLLEYGGKVYLYYDADANSVPGRPGGTCGNINVAVYNGTLTQLCTPVAGFYGISNVTSVYFGTQQVQTVRCGTNTIWARTAPPPTDAYVTNGLALWYKFSNGTGTAITDASGNAKTGTCVNTPAWVATNTSGYGGMTFTRASKHYATIPALACNTNWTICCWIFENSPCSVGYQGAVSFCAQNTGGRGQIQDAANVAYWDFSQAIGGFGVGTYVQGEWHHYVMAHNGLIFRSYYDGAQYGAANVGASGSTPNPIDRIGVLGRYYTDYDGHYLNAKLAGVRVYSRMISSNEAHAVFDLLEHP